MRFSTRLLIPFLLLTWFFFLPQGTAQRDPSDHLHGSAEGLIFALYASPLHWLWAELPPSSIAAPLSVPQTPQATGGEGTAAAGPEFHYDDSLPVETRLSELRRITACLDLFPERLRAPLTKMTVKAGAGNPRALSDGRQIIIHSVPLSDEELCNVVAHEMGHVIDIGLLSGEGFEASAFKDGSVTVPQDDLSVQFYSVSWQSEEVAKADATRLDFATGYSRMNPFEEFGEMTELYVRHGNYLRSLLPTSEALRKKYAFLRDIVFEGTEFNTGNPAENVDERKFDSTLVGIKYN